MQTRVENERQSGNEIADGLLAFKDLDRQTQQVLNAIPEQIFISDGSEGLLYANKMALDYYGVALEGCRSEDFRARACHPEDMAAKVIIMTTFDSEEDFHRSIKAGARGYLLKDASQEEILDAIRRVNLGETYLPARIAQKVAEGLRKKEVSPRELEVLLSVAAGKSNKEIGVQLFIAEGTVKSHVKSLLEKLDVPGRTAAIREAVHRGLFRLD